MAEAYARDPAVAQLLEVLEAALGIAAPEGSAAHSAVAKVLGRCRAWTGGPAPTGAQDGNGEGNSMAARLVADALALPRGEARRPVARAFAALAPRLHWTPKTIAKGANIPPMNTMLLGPGGVEERDDIWIGASALAPETTYPVHRHPPEEVYLPLTPGEWWNEKMDWRDPTDGVIYNPPGIRHSMRAGAQPLLAIWLLPL